MMTSPQTITLGELRASGVHGLLICCGEYCCEYSISIDTNQWPNRTQLSELENKLTCMVCGARRVDIRPDFD